MTDSYATGLVPVLVPEESVKTRVAELAQQISTDYAGRELTLVCTLAGSVVLLADLMRQLTIPCTCTFLHTVPYGGPGEVRIVLDTLEAIEGRHVLALEGAVVSGITLRYVLDWLRLRHPASLKCCALVVKRTSLKVDVPVEYVGFEIEQGYAVGYGMAHNGRFRNLPYLADARGLT